MSARIPAPPRRVLVVDDSPDIHNLFRKMLLPEGGADPQLASLENELFGLQPAPPDSTPGPELRIDSAMQGEEAVEMVGAAADDPYFLAFVDVRMPPGIDGIATIKRLWPLAPDLYTVICTAYSDYSWEAISRELGHSPNLLILRKPFESIEVRQVVATVSRMYDALAAMRASLEHLQGAMAELEGVVFEGRARTAAACSHAADAVLFVGPDGRVVEAHARHEALAPLRAAAKGAHVRDLLPGFTPPSGGASRDALAVPGGVPLAITAHPLGGAAGDPEGVMLLCHVKTTLGRPRPRAGAPMQDDLAGRFRLNYDREGYRRVIAGHEVIVHCHHYNARIQSTIEGATQIDGKAILSSSAEAVFGEQVRAAFLPADDEAARWRVAAALYAHLGYGSLDFARLSEGVVVQTSSHFVEGWNAGFRGRNAPVCTFTEGFLQGAAHAVTGQAVYVRERACMAAGASACEFAIERGRSEPIASFAKQPVTFAPKKGGTYVRSPNVDQEAIISTLVEMPIRGDDEGLIPAFGVYLANMPADFYNLVCIRFVEEMAKQGLFKSACRLLTYDAETCGMNTFRGIMSSAEWDGLVAPMIRDQADNFFAIVAISNALGWGNWRPVAHVPGERATLESLNGYEALGYLGYRGTSRLPQCFMLTGVAAGILELLYATGPIESRFGRFVPSEEACICTGRPSCTFDVTKV